jgi:hypothetical protein
MIEERTIGIKTDDQIKVGCRRRITPGDRPEDAHVMRAILLCEGQNRVAMLSNRLL